MTVSGKNLAIANSLPARMGEVLKMSRYFKHIFVFK
jgi:hypothetical protein